MMKNLLSGRVFVTGGSGSWGKALLSEIRRNGWDCSLVVYSNDEAAHAELGIQYPEHQFVLGDIRDCDWMACKMEGCDAVIHAAAFKGVPAVEQHPVEAIKTNVLGSINVAIAAGRAGIPTAVAISTDKACCPVNTYGYTKALMESVIMNVETWNTHTMFKVVRLGNFIGSRGSVIPLFAKQGGRLTVTDKRMTRFWMTFREAVRWTLIALRGKPGHIIAPKLLAMGIEDVAKCVSPDAELVEIGARPGERMYEMQLGEHEVDRAIDYGSHFDIFPVGSFISAHADGEYSSASAPKWERENMKMAIDDWRQNEGYI